MQQAFRELLDFMKPGMREEEACAYLEYRMRCLGADGVSFPSIVAADANAALPHAIPGKTKLKRGGMKTQELPPGWEPVGGGAGSDGNGLFTAYVMACRVQ